MLNPGPPFKSQKNGSWKQWPRHDMTTYDWPPWQRHVTSAWCQILKKQKRKQSVFGGFASVRPPEGWTEKRKKVCWNMIVASLVARDSLWERFSEANTSCCKSLNWIAFPQSGSGSKIIFNWRSSYFVILTFSIPQLCLIGLTAMTTKRIFGL